MSRATQLADLHESGADTNYHLMRLLNIALARGDRRLQQLLLEEAEAHGAAALERMRVIYANENSGGA